jgi:hypothetical protein
MRAGPISPIKGDTQPIGVPVRSVSLESPLLDAHDAVSRARILEDRGLAGEVHPQRPQISLRTCGEALRRSTVSCPNGCSSGARGLLDSEGHRFTTENAAQHACGCRRSCLCAQGNSYPNSSEGRIALGGRVKSLNDFQPNELSLIRIACEFVCGPSRNKRGRRSCANREGQVGPLRSADHREHRRTASA